MAARKARIAQAYLQIVPSMDGFFASINKETARSMPDAGKKAGSNWGKSFADSAKESMKGLAVAVAATTAVAMAGAAVAIKKGVLNASDLNENLGAVQAVFGDVSGAVESFSKTAAKSFGISQNQALAAAKDFGIFGKVAGLTGNDLSKFSNDFTGLAADLSSFGNTTPEEALTALSAGLRGESEPLRKYGILLDDVVLKNKALELGIYSGTGSLTSQQRVMAAQAVIFAQSATQQGAFARESAGWSGQVAIAKARLENLSTTLGKIFLPTAIKVLGAVSNTVIPFAENWITAFGPKITTMIENFVSYIGGLIDGTRELPVIFIKVFTAGQYLVNLFTAWAPIVGVIVEKLTVFGGILTAQLLPALSKMGEYFAGIKNGSELLPNIFSLMISLGVALLEVFKAWAPVSRQLFTTFLDISSVMVEQLIPILGMLSSFISNNTGLLVALSFAFIGIKASIIAFNTVMIISNGIKAIYNAYMLISIARTYGLIGATYAFTAGSKLATAALVIYNTVTAVNNGILNTSIWLHNLLVTRIWGTTAAWTANTAGMLKNRIMSSALVVDLIKTTAWVWNQKAAIASLALSWAKNTAAMLIQKGVMFASLAWLGAVTIAQWAWNAAITANPIGIIIVAIGALVAGIIWLATQTTFFQDAWAAVSGFVMASLKNMGNFFGTVGNAIGAFFGGVGNVIKTVWRAVYNYVIGIVNGMIGAINFVIKAINGLKVPIPEWARSLFGGQKTLGFNIKQMGSIPALKTGGDIMGSKDGAVIRAGEDYQAETVTNKGMTNRFIASTLKLVEGQKNNSQAPIQQNIKIEVIAGPGMSEEELARKVGRAVRVNARR